jgi:hypothetical protein
MQSEQSRVKLCSTRRGGGLPFFIEALITTALPETMRLILDKCMKSLLALAEAVHLIEDNNFSQVLSMYVLSKLFKEARIGEEVLKYAERALIVAINGFNSVNWNIRNACTLLFSSLINRIFGVNRSKEEISKKNT